MLLRERSILSSRSEGCSREALWVPPAHCDIKVAVIQEHCGDSDMLKVAEPSVRLGGKPPPSWGATLMKGVHFALRFLKLPLPAVTRTHGPGRALCF